MAGKMHMPCSYTAPGDPGSAWRGRWGLVCLGVFGLFEWRAQKLLRRVGPLRSEDAKHSRRRRQGRRREEKDALKQLLLEGPKGLQEGNRSLSDWFENLPFRKPKEAGGSFCPKLLEAELKHRDEEEAAGSGQSPQICRRNPGVRYPEHLELGEDVSAGCSTGYQGRREGGEGARVQGAGHLKGSWMVLNFQPCLARF